MKRLFVVAVACAFMFGFVCAACAQQAQEDMQERPMMRGPMMGNNQQGEGAKMMREKMEKMLPMMMPRAMVASGDGGVIVLIGEKLQKYDKDLNLVKEVTLQCDKQCPMEKETAEQAQKAAEAQQE